MVLLRYCTKGIANSDNYQRQSFSYLHYSKKSLILECVIRDSRYVVILKQAKREQIPGF